MKRTISILSILVLVAVLAVTTLQVSAHGGGGGGGGQGGNGGQHDGGQGNQNHGGPGGSHDGNHPDGHGNQPGWHGWGTPGGIAPDQTPEPEHQHHYNYKGVIAAVDATGMTLTLRDGSTLAFTFDAQTVFKIPTLGRDGTAADLLIGMQVNVKASMMDSGSLLATKVIVVPARPVHFHRVGQVTEYTAGTSISILAHDGQTYTFQLAADVRILPAELADTLAVGSWVTVIASRDATQVEPVAAAIVIHPVGPHETETPEP